MAITFRSISHIFFGCHFSQITVQNFGACVKIFLLPVSNRRNGGAIEAGAVTPLCAATVRAAQLTHTWLYIT
jgi:hypothetical protein